MSFVTLSGRHSCDTFSLLSANLSLELASIPFSTRLSAYRRPGDTPSNSQVRNDEVAFNAPNMPLFGYNGDLTPGNLPSSLHSSFRALHPNNAMVPPTEDNWGFVHSSTRITPDPSHFFNNAGPSLPRTHSRASSPFIWSRVIHRSIPQTPYAFPTPVHFSQANAVSRPSPEYHFANGYHASSALPGILSSHGRLGFPSNIALPHITTSASFVAQSLLPIAPSSSPSDVPAVAQHSVSNPNQSGGETLNGVKEIISYRCNWGAHKVACDRQFASDGDSISLHLRTFHGIYSNVEPIVCMWLGCQGCIPADALVPHIQAHVGVTWRCSRCRAPINPQASFKGHLTNHQDCAGARLCEIPSSQAIVFDISAHTLSKHNG
ncbi:hypothetical protein BJ138DRAFT_1112351 [Hygrophoropsis aurantiaca]|uniref:Uncharacterized protein n=1 Tax=Hygrophoropsis aurantiaca TaxID=72124 RepID=A0ACB8AIM4_9AGAM|nr:hypothetical protein BJ138DRAFT_1112351 [Hygrophoropsis aurantiaca]